MIVAMSSTAIVLQSLAEKGLMKTPGGQACFSVLLFQDIAVIPILALLPLLAVDASAAAASAPATSIAALPGWQKALVTLGVGRRHHSGRAISAAPLLPFRRRRKIARSLHRHGAAPRRRHRPAHAIRRPLAGAGHFSRRRGAGGERISASARGRHRAVQRPAARALFHLRRREHRLPAHPRISPA